MSAPPDSIRRDALEDAAIHERWVSLYRSPEAQRFYEMAFDEIVKRLDIAPGSVLLDAGCGSCAKSVLLAARGIHIVGADLSEDALALAAKTIAANGVAERVTLKQANLLDLPFADGQFRYVMCWGVLMHVPELEVALAQLARVLAPGGVLILSEANMYSAQSVVKRGLKKALGKVRGRLERTAAGIVAHENTSTGSLVTRHTDMRWLEAHCRTLGLRLAHRIPGQFTELYVNLPTPALRRAVHAFNAFWFRAIKRPGPAFGNILLFEKRGSPAAQ